MGLTLPKLGPLTKLASALGAGKPSGPPTGSLPIAADFGRRSLKLLQLTGGGALTLTAAASHETPDYLLTDHPRRLEHQLAELPRLIREGGFKGKRIAFAIPAWMAQVRAVNFNRVEGVPLAELAEQTLATQHHVDTLALATRVYPLGAGTGPKVDVLTVSVPRAAIQQFMRAAHAARLELVGLHNEFTALAHAFEDQDDGGAFICVDIGAGATRAVIVHNREVFFARTVDVGGIAIDEAIARKVGCEPNQARTRRHNCEKLSPDTEEGAAIAEPLDIIADEVLSASRFFATAHPGKKLTRVIFVGGEARQQALGAEIARRVRLPAQAGDPLARVTKTGSEPARGVDMRLPQPGWTLAMGLALAPTDL